MQEPSEGVAGSECNKGAVNLGTRKSRRKLPQVSRNRDCAYKPSNSRRRLRSPYFIRRRSPEQHLTAASTPGFSFTTNRRLNPSAAIFSPTAASPTEGKVRAEVEGRVEEGVSEVVSEEESLQISSETQGKEVNMTEEGASGANPSENPLMAMQAMMQSVMKTMTEQQNKLIESLAGQSRDNLARTEADRGSQTRGRKSKGRN